jgi:hypothetical protein
LDSVDPQTARRAEAKVNDDQPDDINEAIQRTAYFLWEQDGRPDGKAQYYWELAKEKHRRQRAYDLWLEEGAPDGEAEKFWDKARGGMP